jgi:hypothetical protein
VIADGGSNDERVKWQCHDVVVFINYPIVDPPEAVSCVKDSFVSRYERQSFMAAFQSFGS